MTRGWLGAVLGHHTRSLGVEHFGQTGSLAELYRHSGIDADGIVVHIGSEQMHWYQHWYVWAGAAAVIGGTVTAFALANRAPTRIEGF